jgi:hypothetical protein
MAVGNTGTAFLISLSLQSVPKEEGTLMRRVLGVMWAVTWPIADIKKNWSVDVICQLPEIGNKVNHIAGNCTEGMVVSNEISFFTCTTHFVTTVYLTYVSLPCWWIVTNHILSCVSKQVDLYVRLMLRMEQCYGMDMYCTLYYVPCKWHTSIDQKGYIILVSDVWFEVCMNCHIMKTILFLFLWGFDRWHVTIQQKYLRWTVYLFITYIYQLNHTKMEIANEIIYTLPRVKWSLLMYLCHFPHMMNVITELQLVPSIVITCWWHNIPSSFILQEISLDDFINVHGFSGTE